MQRLSILSFNSVHPEPDDYDDSEEEEDGVVVDGVQELGGRREETQTASWHKHQTLWQRCAPHLHPLIPQYSDDQAHPRPSPLALMWNTIPLIHPSIPLTPPPLPFLPLLPLPVPVPVPLFHLPVPVPLPLALALPLPLPLPLPQSCIFPSTLSATLRFLYPIHYTLYPIPYTLYPIPSDFYTLDPKP